jgi:predicted P-loop ATPase
MSISDKSVTGYLAALVWDGTPRLDRWLIDCAGAEDSTHVRAASRMMLVAAVRRARSPGCKLGPVLVIVGPQGCGKSSALRLLAFDDWYTHDFPLDERRLMEAALGKWIVEARELMAMGRHEAEALKASLARTHDTSRRAYAREVTREPRQFVIVGTTSEADYLNDLPGNRRILTVRISGFDLDRLRAMRDQLWAEAAEAEAHGESVMPALSMTASSVDIGDIEIPDYTPVTDVEIEDTLEVLEYVARESIKAERAHKVVERMRQELGALRALQPRRDR